MQPIQQTRTRELLSLFKQHVDKNKALTSNSLKKQLNTIFITPPWSNKTYLRSSLRGRLSSWLCYPFEKRVVAEKTYKAFGEMLTTLSLSELQSLGNFELTLGKLCSELQNEGKLELPENSSPLFSSPEIDLLTDTQEAQAAEKTRQRFELSLLRQEPPPSSENFPIETTEFQNYFRLGDSSLQDSFQTLESLATRYPHHAHSSFEERLKLIKEATAHERAMQESLMPQDTPLEEEERQKKLCSLSVSMAETIQGLNATQPKKLLFFSYGRHKLSLEALFSKLYLLPKEAIELLPQVLRTAIDSRTMPNPSSIAKDIVTKFFEEIHREASRFKKDAGKEDSPSPFPFPNISAQTWASLFANNERELPDFLSKILPDVFENYCSQAMKDGIIGNTSHFFSNPKIRQVIDWLAHNSNSFLTDEGRNHLAKDLEEKAFELLESHLAKYLSKFEDHILENFRHSSQIIPPELIELAGLDFLLLSGPLWLEFEKQADGNFSLAMYSLGRALSLHPKDEATGIPYCASRIRNIKEENITPYFFQTLLSRHFEPLWNPLAAPKVRDIYTGPIQSLGGEIAPNHDEDMLVKGSSISSETQLALHLLLKNQNPGLPRLDIYLDLLLNYCRPLLTGTEQNT